MYHAALNAGWYIHPEGENSMAVFGFGCKNPSVGHLSYFKCKWP